MAEVLLLPVRHLKIQIFLQLQAFYKNFVILRLKNKQKNQLVKNKTTAKFLDRKLSNKRRGSLSLPGIRKKE